MQPYRTDLQPGQCILCGKFCRDKDRIAAGEKANGETQLCTCPSAAKCMGCMVSIINV